MTEPIDEYLIKALAKPNDYSGNCRPDGTPMTNFEYYKEVWKNPVK